MKKVLFCLFSLLVFSGNMKSQTVSVADVEALPGETVFFSVSLSNGQADTYTAMTLYAQFPASGFTTTGAYTISKLWVGASGTVGDVKETGLATIPFSSANVIPGTAVDNLVTVGFKVAETVAIGEYDVTLKKTMFEYNKSDKAYADDVTFKVKVVSAHNVTLNETSTTAPESAEGVNVKVIRTIDKDVWSTICLPFAMSEEQVKAAFGDDVKLADFKGYDATYDSSKENVLGLTVNFESVTAIEANHPYIIKVSSNITEFTVDGVNIDPEDEPSVSFGFTTGKGKNAVYHPIDFNGTYVADFDIYNNASKKAIFLNGNNFYYATENTKHMKAFRAYFDFDDVLAEEEGGPSGALAISLFVANGEITKIDARTMKEIETGRVYNLAGQYIGEKEDMNQLPKGIYIVNGKKIVR